jgi:hypothetical protein
MFSESVKTNRNSVLVMYEWINGKIIYGLLWTSMTSSGWKTAEILKTDAAIFFPRKVGTCVTFQDTLILLLLLALARRAGFQNFSQK